MKITIYELLGLVKEGKAPKIKYDNHNWKYNTKDKWFDDIDRNDWCKTHFGFCELNDEVEIIEEEKEIEKLDIKQEKNIKNNWKWKIKGTEHDYNISTPQKIMCDKINELIDVINDMRDKD